MPNVIDLYAGAGGLSLGAFRAGFNVVAAVEFEKHAIATHRSNFPLTVLIEKDIREVTVAEIEEATGLHAAEITGVIGGPPCQGFSTIGKGSIGDDRNSLFRRFFEMVAQIKPAFFVAENVPGIMREKYDNLRQEAFELIGEEYNILEPICINAADFGAATLRMRYFFIGIRPDSGIAITEEDFKNAKVPLEQQTTSATALEGLPESFQCTNLTGFHALNKTYADGRRRHLQNRFFYQHITGLIPEGVGNKSFIANYKKNHVTNGFLLTKHSEKVKKRYFELAFGKQDKISKSKKLDPNAFCPTLRAGTGPEKGSFQAVRPIHYSEARVITPREAARLQGFPDWFELPNTIWHSFRQIGNSVSPFVAEAVLKVIFDHLPVRN